MTAWLTAATQPRDHCWRPKRGVVWFADANAVVLLSLDTGQYHTLNDSAGAIWKYICSGSAEVAIPELVAAEYGIAPSRELASDVHRVLADLSARQLAEPIASVARDVRAGGAVAATPHGESLPDRSVREHGGQTTFNQPRLLSCLCRLAIVHLALRLISVRRVLRYVYAQPKQRYALSNQTAVLDELSRRVDIASALYPARTQCLEKSLCLVWLARRAGIPAVLRLGAVSAPFAAHAWVEHRDVPINDNEEHLRIYRRFPPIVPDTL